MHRHDIYGPAHKGLRLALSRLVIEIGQTDFTDLASSRETIAALRRQMAFSEGHLHHEELEIHGPLNERAPGSVTALDCAHAHHRASFVWIEELMQRIENAIGDERRRLGRDLYLRFTQFVGEDFEHMAEEETITLPLLWEHFTDEELMAMEGRIVGSLKPDEAIFSIGLMIPAMNPAERIRFLSFARSSAPPPAFDAMLNHAVRPALDDDAFADLSRGLGLAA
jgi:hypothetical protein